MQKNGKIAAEIRGELVQAAQPGVTTLELDKLAAELFKKHGVTASFKNFKGYPHHIVVCLNEQVVHGMPSERKLQVGDLLTVDLGVFNQGYHVDTARTIEVGNQEFLRIGQEALKAAIAKAVPDNHVGDISNAMQKVIEMAGYSVIRAYVGHGVGQKLHQPPQIPCYGRAGSGPILKKDQALAVEVMYTRGGYEIDLLNDGWTTVTRDNSLAAMFEDTVIVNTSPLVVTA